MTRPRLAFVGTGWIGAARMRAVVAAGAADAAVIADADTDTAEKCAADVGCSAVEESLEAALEHPVDGVVLATPSALHAAQSLAALRRGVPVFCQKPLGRTRQECAAIVDAARATDLLLGVDLSYRHVDAFRTAAEVVRRGDIGRVHAADLVFHNAYGPDKAWFTDPALAGGGCVIDLGTHLVDYAQWVLGAAPQRVTARLYARGEVLQDPSAQVEDYAVAQCDMPDGAVVRLACSWFLNAGTDAVIEATFHGTDGAVAVRNIAGSFYDFACDLHRGRQTQRVADPGDEWGGRALIAWANQLAKSTRFDPAVESAVAVATTIDRLYGRAA